MQRINIVRVALGALFLIAALGLSACASKTPEEKVAEARSRYTVRLNSFIVHETPVEEPEPVGEAEEGEEAEPAAVPAATEDEGGEDDEMELAPLPEVRSDVELDLIVQHDLDRALPGITLDVTMVGPDKTEKAAWKVYVETAGLPEANQKQFSHVLEDVDYEDGDGFSAEVRSSVPAEERGEYREFSEAGGD